MKPRPRSKANAAGALDRWEEDGGPARQTQARAGASKRGSRSRLAFVAIVLFWLWVLWVMAGGDVEPATRGFTPP